MFSLKLDERFGKLSAFIITGIGKGSQGLVGGASRRCVREPRSGPTSTFAPQSISITGTSNTYRITSKGQVTIPLEIRERLRLLPHTEVRFEIENGGAVIRKANSNQQKRESRGAALVSKLRGKATVKTTTEEILALTRK